jgi:hypothetical protein
VESKFLFSVEELHEHIHQRDRSGRMTTTTRGAFHYAQCWSSLRDHFDREINDFAGKSSFVRIVVDMIGIVEDDSVSKAGRSERHRKIGF